MYIPGHHHRVRWDRARRAMAHFALDTSAGHPSSRLTQDPQKHGRGGANCETLSPVSIGTRAIGQGLTLDRLERLGIKIGTT
jgi:hypothetical protein